MNLPRNKKIPSKNEIVKTNLTHQPGDDIFKLVQISEIEAESISEESIAFKATNGPSSIDLILNRLDLVEKNLENTTNELNRTKTELDVLKMESEKHTLRYLNSTFSFRLMGLIQTAFAMESILAARYIPGVVLILGKNDLRFRDIEKARSRRDLKFEIDSFFSNPLVVSLIQIQGSEDFIKLKNKRNLVAHEPISDLNEFEENLNLLKNKSMDILPDHLVNLNWMNLCFSKIKLIFDEINKKP